jgi:hypothetical protein
MEVEIISREIIKPSSPTSSHLKIFKMSFIDQISGEALIRFISFYRCRDESWKIGEMLDHLKSSLSETLTRYYPLAGESVDSSTIDCNDRGAMVVTAQVNCRMDELIRLKPKFELFHKLGTSSKFYSDGDFQVSVQFNIFSCGAMGICLCFSHRIADATTIAAFLKCWAAIARGSRELANFPEYKSALLFPPRKSVPTCFPVIISRKLLLTEGKSVRRRFVFDGSAISKLKARGSSKFVPNPTSAEVVSSFIWKHAMAAAKVVRGVQQPSMLIHSADLRRLMVPPLRECSVGNLVWLIHADYDAADQNNDIELQSLVEILRVAKQKNRDEFVPKLQTDGHYETMHKFLEEFKAKCSKENLNLYLCSSWCKMGINELDFGWGVANWLALVGGTEVESMFKNFILLIDGGSINGIEAWLILEQREMAVFETNEEFLAYASSNPGISSDHFN